MANTYTLIASSTVGSGGAASIDFTSIPATYTDLCLKVTARDSSTSGPYGVLISFNGSASNFSGVFLEGNGASASSGNLARYIGTETPANYTASTFSNIEVYIPNYAGSNNKSFSADGVSENNATTAYATLNAGLWSITTAINQITLYIGNGTPLFAQYSTAYLYGISKS
jgi:hypothetical protein